MGKKSKSKAKQDDKQTTRSVPIPHHLRGTNVLPRSKIFNPIAFEEQCTSIHPIQAHDEMGGWINVDSMFVLRQGETTLTTSGIPFTNCPVCFQQAVQNCSRCKSVSYCSKECQIAHWKSVHKKCCMPNPKPAKLRGSLSQFKSLTPDDFKGHEFLLIKPTGQLNSIEEICHQCLESADDILDIPGFGHNQLEVMWAHNNQHDPTAIAIREKYGWSSGTYAIETMAGYSRKEDNFCNLIICDDSFQSMMDQEPNYYGYACFPDLFTKFKQPVRGNLVMYRIIVKNRKIQNNVFHVISLTEDSDLEYEYEICPLNKAEVARMLFERMNNLEDGTYSRRHWRHEILSKERRI